jgi:hypothetical protein
MSNLPVKWTIIIKTAEKLASGIDTSVFLKFHGDKGAARPVEVRARHRAAYALRACSELASSRGWRA